ncbi:MAG: YheT family hydrolase, partial [Polyangiales bacterium]
LTPWWAQARGHVATLAGFATQVWQPKPQRRAAVWSCRIDDARMGSVRLTGLYHAATAPKAPALVLVHGLGGSAQSPYLRTATRAALARGWHCLRLHLRGADGAGEDFYHAGLVADVQAALLELRARGARQLCLLGYSLGGHIALRYAALRSGPQLRAVAAICPPLDLAACARHLDQPAALPYRRYLLRSLSAMYRAVWKRGRALGPTPAEAAAIRYFRDWDGRIVAPRHGFASAEDYWHRACVRPVLGHIETPTVIVSARHDPLLACAARAPSALPSTASRFVRHVELEEGGHVALPRLQAPPTGRCVPVEAWLLRWMAWQCAQ